MRGTFQGNLRAWILSTKPWDATREFNLASGIISSLFPKFTLAAMRIGIDEDWNPIKRCGNNAELVMPGQGQYRWG